MGVHRSLSFLEPKPDYVGRALGMNGGGASLARLAAPVSFQHDITDRVAE